MGDAVTVVDEIARRFSTTVICWALSLTENEVAQSPSRHTIGDEDQLAGSCYVRAGSMCTIWPRGILSVTEQGV